MPHNGLKLQMFANIQELHLARFKCTDVGESFLTVKSKKHFYKILKTYYMF